MAAREHHAELLAFDHPIGEGFVDRRCERPLRLEHSPELGGERSRGSLLAHDIDRPILRGRHEPCCWIVGQPAHAPHLERATDRIMRDIFGERDVVHAEDARQRGDHAPGFAPEEVRIEVHFNSCERSEEPRCRSDTPATRRDRASAS